MKRLLGLGGMLPALSLALAMPGAIRLDEHRLAAASCGVRSTLWIEHYAAVLYLPGRESAAQELTDPAISKALQLHIINKRLMPSDIPPKWREPMERHLDAEELARGRAAYQALSPGDRMTMAYAPGNGVILEVNGRPMATASGHGLVEAILETWADGEPLPGKLQRIIARNRCGPGAVADTTEVIRATTRLGQPQSGEGARYDRGEEGAARGG